MSDRGRAVRKRAGWRGLLTGLGLTLAAAAVALLALYALSRALALRTDYDWFHAGAGLLGLAGFGAMVAVVIWSFAMLLRRRLTKRGRTRFLLAVWCGVFGAASIAVGIVTFGPLPERTSHTGIWAGYRSERNGVTAVRATWTVPAIRSLGRRPNSLSAWVGLDDAGRHLEQIGIAAACQRHTRAEYWAWYELFPAGPTELRLTLHPNDTVVATVVRFGADRFRLTVTDTTTGTRFSTAQVVRHVGNTHGVIVIEESDYLDEVLADFSPIRFLRCAFDGRPIADFALTSLEIQNDGDDAPETITSAVDEHGTSFTVARRTP